MVETADPDLIEGVNILYQEAKELNLIFSAIVNSTNKNTS